MPNLERKVTLRLRDLESGAPAVKELPSVDDACGWLERRPVFVEVLGVVFEGISREDNDRMKAAVRPLDPIERQRAAALDAKDEAERSARHAERAKETEAQEQAARDAAKTADPHRPMELRYRFDRPELENTDPLDERAIPEAATKAVLAWVYERMEWVASRGQTVGEAKVRVLPGALAPSEERVLSGSFVPVTAGPRGSN